MSLKKDAKDILNLENDFYKKPRINSRTKGNTFERALAKKLNVRFDTKEFCRTPGSGAFATTHKLPDYLQVHGDLITPQNFKFVIEAKRGYDIKFEDLWKPKSNLFSFIAQAARDGEKALFKGVYYLYLLEDLLALKDDIFFL